MRRICGFDSLRLYMVLFVIMLHGAMSYMEFVPQWQYVINPDRSIFFTALVIFLDSFPMSVLFFLAGYFAPPSFEKRGLKSFIKDKFMRIALPGILGVIFIAPFFAYSSMLSLNFPPMPAALFIKSAFFGPFYQQSVYWFLMVLFFFFLIYAVFKNFCVKKVSIKFSPSLILILFALSFASYSASVFYIKPAADWINIGYILYFQPARIAGYFLVFIFGAAAFSNNWFFNGKFALTAPFLISILSAIFMFGRTFIFAPFLSPAANIILEAFFYNAASLSIMFFLTALFFKIKNSFRFSSALSEFSYGVYFLHQIILMPVIYILIPYSVPIFFKWLAAVAITFFASLAIAKFVLKKAPLLKEIF